MATESSSLTAKIDASNILNINNDVFLGGYLFHYQISV